MNAATVQNQQLHFVITSYSIHYTKLYETIQDTTAPILSGVPADVTAECSVVPAAAVIGTEVTATDNCDTDVTITYTETRTDGSCPDSYTLTRTWTATDNCGNQTTGSQLVTIP